MHFFVACCSCSCSACRFPKLFSSVVNQKSQKLTGISGTAWSGSESESEWGTSQEANVGYCIRQGVFTHLIECVSHKRLKSVMVSGWICLTGFSLAQESSGLVNPISPFWTHVDRIQRHHTFVNQCHLAALSTWQQQ